MISFLIKKKKKTKTKNQTNFEVHCEGKHWILDEYAT